ncbi:MAG TPA: inositol monophosphatase family protein [Nannocystaceae bacterium]|nr:inositol monophosphatase family protein [Nannocystaceae bacterium]
MARRRSAACASLGARERAAARGGGGRLNAYADDLELAIATAKAAGSVLLRHFEHDLDVTTKSSAIDLVTDADRAAEEVIIARLQRERPDDGILAEESGSIAGGGRRWIVDPLDGTTNFAHRFPHWSVSIALWEGEQPLVGVVHDALRNETFSASFDGGAYLDSPRHDHQRVTVTTAPDLQSSLLATGFSYGIATAEVTNVPELAAILPRVQGIRRAGSAALDLAYVAAGRVDGYWEYALAPWDWAAGVLLVREAGAEIATIEDTTWSLTAKSIVVAGPVLFPRMLEVLRAAAVS